MKLWATSLDYKNATLEERSVATPKDGAAESLLQGLSDAVFLATCNRIEIFAFSEDPPAQVQKTLDEWQESCQFSDELRSKIRVLYDDSALIHLFRVCGSLESMVLGETQITGQVRKAYHQAEARGWCSGSLHLVFQSAFRVAKRIRSETEIGQFAVSLPSVGVKLAERVVGDMGKRSVGIIGMGEIGRVAAEHFASVQPKSIRLYNRTKSKSENFATEISGDFPKIEICNSYEEVLQKSDVIVSAVSASIYDADKFEELVQRGEYVFILDLAVPSCVPQIKGEKIFQYFVDDLKTIAEENSQLREQELEKCNSIILEEATKLWRRFETTTAGQTFERLQQKISEIRELELQDLRSRLKTIDASDWSKIEKMSERLSSKILHDPILELRSRIEKAEDKETWLEFFRNIFKI